MSTRRNWQRACFGTILALVIASWPARAGSIFDDDYVPPSSRPKHPEPATGPTPPAPPPLSTTEPKSPAQPKVNDPNQPPTPTRAPSRRAIPAAPAQALARKLMKEVYATGLADRSPAARRALARQLVDASGKAADAPTDQFVLLAGARQSAIEAGDWATAFKACDAMAAAFDVDALRMKADVAHAVPAKAAAPDLTYENCRAALGLIEQFAATDDYAEATRIASAIDAAASTDVVMGATVQRRTKELAALDMAHERLRREFEKLRTSPDDPAAASAVGAFLCFQGRLAQWPTPPGARLGRKAQGPRPARPRRPCRRGRPIRPRLALVGRRQATATVRATPPARPRGRVVPPRGASVDRPSEVACRRPHRRPRRGGRAEPAAADGPRQGRDGGVGRGAPHSDPIRTSFDVRVPFRADVLAQTDSTSIRLYFAKGMVIVNWETNLSELRYHDPADGHISAFPGKGSVPTNEWVALTWIVDEDGATLLVNGEERARVTAKYAGLSPHQHLEDWKEPKQNSSHLQVFSNS